MRRGVRGLPVLLVTLFALFSGAAAAETGATYGLSLFGHLKYGPDFTHFDYADPSAPKGGTMRYSSIGTFDTLNPFVINGVAAAGIGMTFDTLAASSEDEPASEYGLVAKSMAPAADGLSILFTLHERARFHDGSPITPADVIWTFDELRKNGLPFYRSSFAGVTRVAQQGKDGVRFYFRSANDRQLPQIIGGMPVLSKADWQGRHFQNTTLKPPLGSGPYEVAAVNPGQSITYKRVKNYWGRNLPVNKGRYNADTIRYDYYRDATVALEAFKAGEYDLRIENAAKDWATGYASPALSAGLIKKVLIPNRLPSGMQGFGYNLRRPIFADRRVRKALGYAFDFEWENKYLFYGEYTRTRSYFDNSNLAATGLPGAREQKILDPLRGKLPDSVFTKVYNPPEYQNPQQLRAGLDKGIALLEKAGWHFKNMRLVNDKTGQPFVFTILLYNPQFVRVALPFVQNLKRMGVTARIRTVDTAQYQNLMNNFDYDMAIVSFPQSLTPGNEQRDYWGSAAAKEPGSDNVMGIKSKVIDDLITGLVHARTHRSLIAHTRALDRVLQWEYYLIPQFHIGAFRVAYWNKFGRPKIAPKYGVGFNSWWVDPAREAAVKAAKARLD